MRALCTIAVLSLMIVSPVQSENLPANSPPSAVTESVTNHWAFSASLYGYIIPESRDYVNPNLTADHGWLHLEARYNYEALDTASLWVGYNLSVGEKLVFEITPMLGGVFGDLTGIAPGYNLSLS